MDATLSLANTWGKDIKLDTYMGNIGNHLNLFTLMSFGELNYRSI